MNPTIKKTIGKFPFEEIFALAEIYQKKFYKAAKTTKLPKEPNTDAINKLMIQVYEMGQK